MGVATGEARVVLMLLVLSAGGAGVFGNGVASNVRQSEPGNGSTIEYERFGRVGREMLLRVTMTGNDHGNQRQFSLDRPYIEEFDAIDIVPPPVTTEVSSSGLIYTFRTIPTRDRILVTFHLTPKHLGRLAGRIEQPRGNSFDLQHWIYP